MSTKISSPELGRALRDARKRAQIKQEEAAQLIGVSRPTYVAIEQGVRRLHADELAVLADAYGVQPGELLKQAEVMQATKSIAEMLVATFSDEQVTMMHRLLTTEPAISTMQAVKIMACGMSPVALEDVACALVRVLIEREREA